MLNMTNDEFAALKWPDQCAVLRALDNAASNCSGRTMAEADRKRKPYITKHSAFQKIHDAQQQAFINGY